jgi:hypothetical protein
MDLNTLREYLKIHLISLEQDIKEHGNYLDEVSIMDVNYLTGQQVATAHILEYINEH